MTRIWLCQRPLPPIQGQKTLWQFDWMHHHQKRIQHNSNLQRCPCDLSIVWSTKHGWPIPPQPMVAEVQQVHARLSTLGLLANSASCKVQWPRLAWLWTFLSKADAKLSPHCIVCHGNQLDTLHQPCKDLQRTIMGRHLFRNDDDEVDVDCSAACPAQSNVMSVHGSNHIRYIAIAILLKQHVQVQVWL